MAKMKSEATIARPVEDVFRFFLDLDDNAPVSYTHLTLPTTPYV